MATAKLFLDNRKVGADSSKLLTVKIAINHRSSTSYIVTNVKVLSSQWDNTKRCVRDHPKKAMLNTQLLSLMAQANEFLYDCIQQGVADQMSCAELCSAVKSKINGSVELRTAKKSNPNSVENVFLRYIENNLEKERTRSLYKVTLKKIEAFSGKKFHELALTDITYGWLEDFERFLAKSAPSANARAIDLRNLRAVINYAIKHDLIEKYVFRNFTIKTEKTKKRNMSVEALRRIIYTDLEPWMEKYRDFFVLSFMLRGLNAVDLCALPKPVNGRIEWMRTKTNQPLSLCIEPEMLPYIERWSGENLLLCHCDTGRKYRYFNMALSKNLHEIVKYINYQYQDDIVVPDITMYWGRHSWATIASSLRIPLDIIGCGLGHAQRSVTEIYVERDPALVDEANREVLDWVLYGKKKGEIVEQVDLKNYRVGGDKKSSESKSERKHGRPKKEWRA